MFNLRIIGVILFVSILSMMISFELTIKILEIISDNLNNVNLDFTNGFWISDIFVNYKGYAIIINKDITVNGFLIFIILFSVIFTIIILGLFKCFYFIRKELKLSRNINIKDGVVKLEQTRIIQNQQIIENITHEFATPLSVILNYINILINQNEKECILAKKCDTVVEMLENVKYSAITMQDILKKISDYKQLKSNHKSLYDVIKFCDKSVRLAVITKYEIEVDELFKRIESTRLSVGELIAIFTNLIKNSVDAGASKIIFKGEFNKRNFEIYVIDNGAGIDDKIKNKIFNNEVSNKKHGSGFGLYFTKMLLKEIGGDIVIYDTSYKGTTFKLTFPIEE